jgi:hypothetical protein
MFNIYRIIPWCLVRPVSRLLAGLKGIPRSPAGSYSGTLDAACVHLSPDRYERLHDPLLSCTTLDLRYTWPNAILVLRQHESRIGSMLPEIANFLSQLDATGLLTNKLHE